MKPDTFAGRLRALREAAGLSMYRLAQLSGVSTTHLSNLERGEREPSLEIAKKLATALGKGLDCWQ